MRQFVLHLFRIAGIQLLVLSLFFIMTPVKHTYSKYVWEKNVGTFQLKIQANSLKEEIVMENAISQEKEENREDGKQETKTKVIEKNKERKEIEEGIETEIIESIENIP